MNEKLQSCNSRLIFRTRKIRFLLLFLFGFLCLCTAVGCKDDSSIEDFRLPDAPAFDANKAIKVTNCLPDSGGMGTRVVVYGENFGNDTAAVNVTFGGQKARVLSCRSNSLLCLVPKKAWTGELRVGMNNEKGEEIQSGQWESLFKYQSPMVVSTFLGTTYENNTKFDTKEGPFEDCGAFENLLWMKIDPKNPDMMYIPAGNKAFRVVDFKNEYVGIFKHNMSQPFCVEFTLDGDMLVADCHKSDVKTAGLYLLTRESGFTVTESLSPSLELDAIAVNPVNGMVYFTAYRQGTIHSLDLVTGVETIEWTLGKSWRNMFWHPSGKWAYLVDRHGHKIYRMDYDIEKRQLSYPMLVVGAGGGYAEGVGEGARMKEPTQGVFIKNEAYAGKEDEYDFYFCDKNNGCIRILTPEGRVTTYAGRAEDKAAGYRDGALRTEAQFNVPECMTYDEKRKCFYIGDNMNHYIRKISPQDDVE